MPEQTREQRLAKIEERLKRWRDLSYRAPETISWAGKGEFYEKAPKDIRWLLDEVKGMKANALTDSTESAAIIKELEAEVERLGDGDCECDVCEKEFASDNWAICPECWTLHGGGKQFKKLQARITELEAELKKLLKIDPISLGEFRDRFASGFNYHRRLVQESLQPLLEDKDET